MRFGILTFHRSLNPGAFLQAWALRSVLLSFGECQIVDYAGKAQTKRWKRKLYHPRRPLRALGNLRTRLKYNGYVEKLQITAPCHTVHDFETLAPFDCIVYGSDEIWNLENRLAGFDPVFYGSGFPQTQKISYAASFGKTLDVGERKEELAELLNQFSALSVRDDNSARLIKELTGRDADIVLDPTLLVDFPTGKGRAFPKDAILIYCNAVDEDQVGYLKRYARKKGKKLVALFNAHPWCDASILICDPFEWVRYFETAEEVVTNTFHGTVFAIKYGKPLTVLGNPAKQNKIGSFLSRLGLEGNILSEPSEKTQGFAPHWDTERRVVLLDAWRRRSIDFLEQSIPHDLRNNNLYSLAD